jgi:hypothetical protein
MLYQAYELLAKLNCLTLDGQEDGYLEWRGNDDQWRKLKYEEESILRDSEIKKEFDDISISDVIKQHDEMDDNSDDIIRERELYSYNNIPPGFNPDNY